MQQRQRQRQRGDTLVGIGPRGERLGVPASIEFDQTLPGVEAGPDSRTSRRATGDRAAERSFRAFLDTSRADDLAARDDGVRFRSPWPLAAVPALGTSTLLPPLQVERARGASWLVVAACVLVALAIGACAATAYWTSRSVRPRGSDVIVPPPRPT